MILYSANSSRTKEPSSANSGVLSSYTATPAMFAPALRRTLSITNSFSSSVIIRLGTTSGFFASVRTVTFWPSLDATIGVSAILHLLLSDVDLDEALGTVGDAKRLQAAAHDSVERVRTHRCHRTVGRTDHLLAEGDGTRCGQPEHPVAVHRNVLGHRVQRQLGRVLVGRRRNGVLHRNAQALLGQRRSGLHSTGRGIRLDQLATRDRNVGLVGDRTVLVGRDHTCHVSSPPRP